MSGNTFAATNPKASTGATAPTAGSAGALTVMS